MAAELTTGTTYAGLMGVDTVSKEGYGYGHVYSQSGLEANDLLVALRGSNNSETVRAAGYLGGLAGFNSLRGTIDTSATGQWYVYSDNATTASTVGGIVGQNESNVTDKSVLDTVVNCAAVRRFTRVFDGAKNKDDTDNENIYKSENRVVVHVGGVFGQQQNRSDDRWAVSKVGNCGSVFNSRSANVGGVIALLGAAMLGPRIGKYDKDGNPHAIPGHNLTAGALGVFILWFCWFGFNGGSSLSLSTDATMTLTGLVCFNTNLAAAVATCVTMIFTWLRYGKPDVSMTLNGSLAGLVAITAGCDTVSPFGAFFIGFVAGILVVLSVEFFDKIAKVDDPVGAVSVHFANGVWGTIAVGLFSTGANTEHAGLFYGGGLAQLGTQLLGLVTVDIYVVVVMFIIFKLIDKFIGLRVPAEVEIDGLDIHEHGLASAYAGFSISDANSAAMVPNENTDLGEDDVTKATDKQIGAAVPVVREPSPVIHDGVYDTGMHKVSIIAKLSKFDQLKTALNDLGVTGMTVTQVMGCGIQKGTPEKYRGVPVDTTLLPKIKVEVIVSRISVDAVVEAAKKALYTGHIGDGKIFVYNVTRVVKIRTGEEDYAALQDVE